MCETNGLLTPNIKGYYVDWITFFIGGLLVVWVFKKIRYKFIYYFFFLLLLTDIFSLVADYFGDGAVFEGGAQVVQMSGGQPVGQIPAEGGGGPRDQQ